MAMTTLGLAAIVTKIGTTFYPAVGTGTSDASAGSTALGAEVVDSGFWASGDAARHADATVTNPTSVSILVAKTYTSTGTKTIGEVGLYSGSTGSNLWCGKKLSPVRSVVSGDTMTVNYTLTLA